MGNYIVGANQQVRVLVLGLEWSGKTSILYRMKHNETVINTIPTKGMYFETI